MKNEQELQAELRRYNLLEPLLKRRIISNAIFKVQATPERLEKARLQFAKDNKLNTQKEITRFKRRLGWSQDDFEWHSTLESKIMAYCEENFLHKTEAYFLKIKESLDTVTYSLTRTKDAYLAQELFLRIDGGERTFSEIASQYSEGYERNRNGLIGPVPMTKAHPIIAEKLRTTKPGILMHPMLIEDWWIILRLEEYKPASFDKEMANKLARELFDEWVNGEAASRMLELTGQTAEDPTNDKSKD